MNIYGNHKRWADEIHYYHKLVLFYLWTYVDIPILIGRYGKQFSLSYRIHSLMMTAIIITTLIFEVAQRVRSVVLQDTPYRDFDAWHVIRAYGIFFICIGQAIGGSLLESLYVSKNNRLSHYKKYFKLGHGIMGMLVWFMGKLQLWKIRGGLSSSLASHHALEQYYAVSSICIAVAVALEVRK